MLIVLPKWCVRPRLGKSAGCEQIGPLPAPAIGRLSRQVPRFAVSRSAGGQLRAVNGLPAAAAVGAPAQLQTISGRNLRPLLVDGEGRAVLAQVGDRDLYILADPDLRSEEHTSELQSLMRNPYAVLCLKQKIKHMKH